MRLQGNPCACRENWDYLDVYYGRAGPSLRVQGERDPADRRAATRLGHPCACRENRWGRAPWRAPVGPSLRVQGERNAHETDRYPERAIPARAGRTRSTAVQMSSRSGHPCACRENYANRYAERISYGPSLRVQGEPRQAARKATRDRAIPARAGRTWNPYRGMAIGEGHPCACRENLSPDRLLRSSTGPSLRVQGEQSG